MHSKYLSGGLFVFDVTAHSLFKSQRQQIQHNVQIMIAQMPHQYQVEMFYLNSTLNFEIPPELVFQLEVYYKVDRLIPGLSAQQKGTTARWYSNKTSLLNILNVGILYTH